MISDFREICGCGNFKLQVYAVDAALSLRSNRDSDSNSDRKFDILDFDFNHNEIFDSSVEHAESRLIRRLFSLTQVNRTYNNTQCVPCGSTEEASEKYNKSVSYENLLSEYTLYTTLESCTQCTGIMNLGNLKEVVYLQTDPGMGSIGNIVFNMNRGKTSL